MKKIFIILLFVGLFKSSFGSCAEDGRTLTEMLFQGKPGTIFTCKVLTFTLPTYPDNIIVSNSDGSIDGKATVEIVTIYFGNIDTNIITLRAGSYLQVGKTYLIYTTGSGRVFGFGGNCDKWTKQVTDNPATINELLILKQFSDIFKNKTTGKYSFINSKGVVIAEGLYRNGEPIKVWKHYYDSGIIKAEYDLENNITSQYLPNGFIKGKTSINQKVTIDEQYSDKVNGQLKIKFIETKNDTGYIENTYEYFVNGNLHIVSSQIILNVKNGVSPAGKTGIYEEYYETGKLLLKGQYDHNRKVGIWKWYKDNGDFNTEFDYKDGVNGGE
jgi:antitoxin component YwqK of YwqJK toxin-antitoxin module